MQIKSEQIPEYISLNANDNNIDSKVDINVDINVGKLTRAYDDGIIKQALNIIKNRMIAKGIMFEGSKTTQQYCQLHLADSECEQFAVLFLDNKHKLIASEIMFNGTIDSASVYPREIVKKALQYNAAALIVTHNHPSDDCEPSSADRNITNHIKKACDLLNIRLLDHIIVTHQQTYSFADKGILL